MATTPNTPENNFNPFFTEDTCGSQAAEENPKVAEPAATTEASEEVPAAERDDSITSCDTVAFADVPQQLKDRANWVVWRREDRNGQDCKVPYNPKTGRKAKVDDSSTWSTFGEAVVAMPNYDGLGFMLLGTEYVGFDFDGVVDDGVVEPYVLEILRLLGNPYSETSPSGKGVRAFVKSALPPGSRKFGKSQPVKYGAEIYSGQEAGRYLTVTGKKLSGNGIPASDLTIPYLLCQNFLNDKFRRLWMGDCSDYDGDESRADFHLCRMLAKAFNNDARQVESAFNQGQLADRGKWRERPDYRERTVRKALEGLSADNSVLVDEPRCESYRIYTFTEFLDLEIPPSEPLLGPILKEKYITELYAWRGVGKTFVSMGMGLAVASGSKFLKWEAPRPRRVLYFDGEMAGDEFQQRLRDMAASLPVGLDPAFFIPMNFDTQQLRRIPNIADTSGQQAIEDLIERTQAELVIFDNLSCLAQIGDLDDEKWLPVSQWLLSLRRKGIACLLDHHANKTGTQRGISRKEDTFNVVMKLAHPKNYRPEEGLHCTLSFEKARAFKGDDAAPIDIRLEGGNGQPYVWSLGRVNQELDELVAELREQGLSQRAIAKELNIDKNKVARIIARLRKNESGNGRG